MCSLLNDIKKNQQNLAAGIIILLVVLTLTGIITMDYFEIKNLERNHETQTNIINEAEWAFVETLIQENYGKAEMASDAMAGDITKNIMSVYTNDNNRLIRDITSPRADSDLAKIFAAGVDKKYLNGIKNDNNDPFVASKAGIMEDFSLNRSYATQQRDWEHEIQMHWNQPLGNKAINSIVNQTGERAFWELLPPKNPQHIAIDSMELSDVKKIFLAEGYDGLRGYEFLQPAYITEDGDILGNRDVSNIGTRQHTYKLIVVQGFNVIDVVESKYAKRPVQFEAMKLELKKEYIRDLQDKQIKILAETVIMLLAFLSIARIQHLQKCK